MRFNSIASALLWFWGVLVLLAAFAIGYPALVTHRSMAPLLLLGAWGVAYCVGGFALRKRRWGVRWWGSALCVVSALVLLLMQVALSLPGAAINIAALGFILGSWRAQPGVQP